MNDVTAGLTTLSEPSPPQEGEEKWVCWRCCWTLWRSPGICNCTLTNTFHRREDWENKSECEENEACDRDDIDLYLCLLIPAADGTYRQLFSCVNCAPPYTNDVTQQRSYLNCLRLSSSSVNSFPVLMTSHDVHGDVFCTRHKDVIRRPARLVTVSACWGQARF